MLYIVYLKKDFSSRGKWVLFLQHLVQVRRGHAAKLFSAKAQRLRPALCGRRRPVSVFAVFHGQPLSSIPAAYAAGRLLHHRVSDPDRHQATNFWGQRRWHLRAHLFPAWAADQHSASRGHAALGRGQRFGIRSGSPHLFRSGHSNPQCQPAPGRFTVKIKIKIGNLSLPELRKRIAPLFPMSSYSPSEWQ